MIKSFSVPICTIKAARIDIGKRTLTLTFEATLTPALLMAERVIYRLSEEGVSLKIDSLQSSFDLDDAPTADAAPASDDALASDAATSAARSRIKHAA